MTAAEHTAARARARTAKLKSLRVCADPGNMPMSDNEGEGYQNKIIKVLADDLGAKLSFFWRPYHERGLTRETFENDECDVLMDMPYALQALLTTEPIYRTTYVFAYRNDKDIRITGLDDPVLKDLKIGVFQHSGLREALERRGLKNLELHIISYDADLKPEHQPWRQVQKVIDGELDVAGVWGPFAGWFQTMKGAPIVIQPVNLMDDQVPLEFDLSIGMQRNQVLLKYMLDWAISAQEGRDREDPQGLWRAARPVQQVRRRRGPAVARLLLRALEKGLAGPVPQAGRAAEAIGQGDAGSGRLGGARRRMAQGRRRSQPGAGERGARQRRGAREAPAGEGRRRQRARHARVCADPHRGPQSDLAARRAAGRARRRRERPRQRRLHGAAARHQSQPRADDRDAGQEGRRPRAWNARAALRRSPGPSATESTMPRRRSSTPVPTSTALRAPRASRRS